MKMHLPYLLGLATTCWLGMMLVHECGHMLAALLTGGHVIHLEWPALGFSRTDVSPNPHPLIVAWGGPLFGGCLPLLLTLLARAVRLRAISAEIFSGFCLLANGLYLTAGSLGHIGDAGDLLKFGSPFWSLWLTGLPMAAAGTAQWHLLGPRMGIQQVTKREAIVTVVLGTLLLASSASLQFL